MITIRKSGWLCSMEPWAPELGQLLFYYKREMQRGQQTRGRKGKMKITKETLFQVIGTTGYFPLGLLPRVTGWLQDNDRQYIIEDCRPVSRLFPEPDFSKVAALREGQADLLLSTLTADGGLIIAGTGVGKSFLMAQLCRMYPTLRFLIVAARKAVVQTLYKHLTEALLPGAVGIITGDKNTGPDHRVTVTTARSILKADLKHTDILLFDEAHAVGSNQITEHLAHLHNTRRYGFTASPVRGDGTDMVMEAIFGPVLAEMPYDEAVEKDLVVPIEVHIYPVTVRVDKRSTSLANRRWCYWRNTARNKLIARIARGVPDAEQVLIMTETLEHAVYLQEQLPEFQLIHYGNVKVDRFVYTWDDLRKCWAPSCQNELEARRSGRLDGLTKAAVCSIDEIGSQKGLPGTYLVVEHSDRIGKMRRADLKMSQKEISDLREQFEDGTLKKVISTMTWREGVNFPQLSLLIRADGAASEVSSTQIPGRLSRLSEGKQSGILVDFDDRCNDWSQNRSQARLRVYKQKRWQIVKH